MCLLKIYFYLCSMVFPVLYKAKFKKRVNIKEYFSLCFCLNFTTFLLWIKGNRANFILLVFLFFWNSCFMFAFFISGFKKPKSIKIDNEFLKGKIVEMLYDVEIKERENFIDFYLFLQTISDEVLPENTRKYNDFYKNLLKYSFFS